MPHRRIEPERIEERSDQCPRNGEEFDDGQGEGIADEHIWAQLVEVIRQYEAVAKVAQKVAMKSQASASTALPRTARQEARRRGCPALALVPLLLAELSRRASPTATSAETAANESWKLAPSHRFGLEDDHGERRIGEIAHGEGAPIRDHRRRAR